MAEHSDRHPAGWNGPAAGWVAVTVQGNRLRLLSVLFAVGLVLAACGGGDGGGGDGSAGTVAPADGPPAFSAATLAGDEVDSASFAGSPTVLWFWAPWCTICRAEAPDVAEVTEAFAGEVALYGVAGRGEVPAMEEFVSDTGTGGITHVVDDDGSIWTDYGVAAQPAFAFISAEGEVEVFVGSLSRDDLTARMQALATA